MSLSKISVRFLLMCFFFFLFLIPQVNVSLATEVILEQTSDDDRITLTYATRYRILLTVLKQPLSLDQIENTQTFTVINKKTGESIKIKRATYTGFADKQGLYNKARLWSDFRPDIIYLVTIRYPDGTSEEIETKPIMNTEQSTIFQLFTDRATFTFKPMTVSDTNDVAFKYDFDYKIFYKTFLQNGHRLKLSLTSQGEFSTADSKDNDKIQSSLKSGFSIDYSTVQSFHI